MSFRVFDSADAPADSAALAHMEQELAAADLAAPPVVLPDFHHKGNMEMPSSIAVATRDTIRQTLTSASVNCGMALVALDTERPGRRAVSELYRRWKQRFPYPPGYRRDLSQDEVVRCASEGAHFAADRFGLDPRELERVEEGGRLDIDLLGGADRAQHELPWSVRQLSRIRFGTIGPSNHFIELQVVEEVADTDAAELLGIQEGQVTLQFHGGGGSLPGELGLLFGRRKRYPRAVRAQMAVQKPLYHFARARSVRELSRRRALYFSSGFPPVERGEREGERLMLANAMAMNYGFAFRLSAYANLTAAVQSAFGRVRPKLVVDSPHNSVYEEEVEGRPALVHRHNACRIYPASEMAHHPLFSKTGQPLLLPGTNRTSSYLCVPGSKPERSLNSACHGAGTTIKQMVAAGRSGADPQGRRTLRFSYSEDEPREVPQLDDRGVDEALKILVKHEIVRPVARLRPFAVLN
jgi:tRNA-splicing ligase RtcB (3'-phosphate/5'-hydroxy nucleic acid ligase)